MGRSPYWNRWEVLCENQWQDVAFENVCGCKFAAATSGQPFMLHLKSTIGKHCVALGRE